MPRRQWTEKEDADLVAMRRKGLPRWQIARIMATTEKAVADRLRRVDPELRPWTTEDDLELIRLARDGSAFPEIAETLGRAREAVRSRWASLMGLNAKPAAPARPVNTARDGEVMDATDACEAHLQAILKANPNGFMAWSEKRVGLRGVAPCAPVFYPLKRAA